MKLSQSNDNNKNNSNVDFAKSNINNQFGKES